MKFGILGTGAVGRTIAGRLDGLDHDVMVGTRDPQETLSRTETDAYGNMPYGEWQDAYPGVSLGTFAEAAAHGEIVVNATAGTVSLGALEAAGEENLNGKVLIDICNPLDFSEGLPPTLSVVNRDSMGEQIQRTYPQARVVKTLHTMNAGVMVDPGQLAGADHTVFVAGNDAGAKATVAEILQSFGWSDIMDLGDITAARGTEMMLPVWLRVMGALEQPIFNFKIVR